MKHILFNYPLVTNYNKYPLDTYYTIEKYDYNDNY